MDHIAAIIAACLGAAITLYLIGGGVYLRWFTRATNRHLSYCVKCKGIIYMGRGGMPHVCDPRMVERYNREKAARKEGREPDRGDIAMTDYS